MCVCVMGWGGVVYGVCIGRRWAIFEGGGRSTVELDERGVRRRAGVLRAGDGIVSRPYPSSCIQQCNGFHLGLL